MTGREICSMPTLRRSRVLLSVAVIAGLAVASLPAGGAMASGGPQITANATAGGVPYTAGVWTHQTVTVTFSCTPLSASNQIASLTNPVQVNGPVQNQTASGTCTDTAGNTSVTTFGTGAAGIDVDLARPVATASATTTDRTGRTVAYVTGRWTNHDVTVNFACTDSGAVQSGVASVDPPIAVTAEGETGGVIGGCTDRAGNAANIAFLGPVLIDKTAPLCTVTVIPPTMAPTRMLNPVTANVRVSDGASGPNGFVLVSVTSNNPATGASDITGFSPGTPSTSGKVRAVLGRVYTFTYLGLDGAGNSSAPCTSQVRVTLTG